MGGPNTGRSLKDSYSSDLLNCDLWIRKLHILNIRLPQAMVILVSDNVTVALYLFGGFRSAFVILVNERIELIESIR